MGTHLKISWDYSFEYIRLPDDLRPGEELTTVEDWFELGLVSYRAHVLAFRTTQNGGSLKLEYPKDDQPDLKVREYREELDWGIFKFEWDGVKGTSEYEGKTYKNVKVISFSKPFQAPRTKKSVLVFDRPEQAALRNWLLTLPGENKCAISDEQEPRALEAAHIVEVHKKGSEDPRNAILLRADLHRLFDSGMWWFEVTKKGATVRTHENLSSTYSEKIRGVELAPLTFKRVATALQVRATLPGGRGLGSTGEKPVKRKSAAKQ